MIESKAPSKQNVEIYGSDWKIKRAIQKTWNYIWHDDSIGSWVLNILLAFVIIKFLLYPGLGLVLGTELPVVAVISESMDHLGDFNEWWRSPALCDEDECMQSEFYNNYNISKATFLSFPLKHGFQRGDIIVLNRAKINELNVGDIIVFNSQTLNSYPIIHRIIQIKDENGEKVFVTKGDHNVKPIYVRGYLDESNIYSENIIGKSFFKIPYLGYVKLGFVDLINFGVNFFKG
ncbi:MAG: signal peptidase I [Candidatus Nanoarchaeia archaeon]|nr:signal peptidase I [Candidatus Nanoarchaeia archaeon]